MFLLSKSHPRQTNPLCYNPGYLTTRYTQAVQRIVALHNMYQPTNTRSHTVLEQRVKQVGTFLEFLGNPQEKYRIIHVTGTSGKGSVVSLLHTIVRASGAIVGSLVSPHTTTFLERFQLNEGLISEKSFLKGVDELEKAYEAYLEKYPPLAFRAIATALGLHLFAKEKVDWVIVEVGCGGRFDSTNALLHTEAAVITNVDKDHSEELGDTLEDVAFHKAGIIKPHGLAIVGEDRSRLKKIFMDEAIQKEAALFFATKPLHDFESSAFLPHVNQNIRIASLTAQELGFSKETIDKGLKQYRALPCRFETVSKTPHIVLDGAHNPPKIQSTVDHIKRLSKKPVVLFGTGSGKDSSFMLRKLYPHAQLIHTTRTHMDHKKVANPSTLLKMVPASKRGKAYLDSHHALEEVLKTLSKDDILVITGSLYLAGELRTYWYSETEIIKQATSFPI